RSRGATSPPCARAHGGDVAPLDRGHGDLHAGDLLLAGLRGHLAAAVGLELIVPAGEVVLDRAGAAGAEEVDDQLRLARLARDGELAGAHRARGRLLLPAL